MFVKNFVKKRDVVIMEASGTYYFPLAEYLYYKVVNVVVQNPSSIKRYAQSRLNSRNIIIEKQIYSFQNWELIK